MTALTGTQQVMRTSRALASGWVTLLRAELLAVALLVFGWAAAASLWTDSPGLTPERIGLALAGAPFLVTAALLGFSSVARRLRSHRLLLPSMILWLPILLGVPLAFEAQARFAQNYRIGSWPLESANAYFWELDQLKIYNRRFVAERSQYFKNWPIPLELFDAETSSPRYLFKPNLRKVREGTTLRDARPDEEPYWSSNAFGLRGPQITVEKPPGVIRVACIGASTTEGIHHDRETYPVALQHEFERRFPDQNFEVINAGHHGQGVADILAVFKQRVLPLHPDIAVFYEAANDAYVPEYLKDLPCTMGFPRGDCWLIPHGAAFRWAYRHSAAFAMLANSRGWTDSPPMPHNFDTTSPKQGPKQYRETLGKIVDAAKAAGVQMVLTSFVTLAHDNFTITRTENREIYDYLHRNVYPVTAAEYAYVFAEYNQQSREVAAENGVPYLDLAAVFPKEVRFFSLDIFHLTYAGNQALAQYIADGLAADVLPALSR